MAKVNMPLMSAEARGKLADSIVFFPWKGIAAVRQWVVPANPKTSDQQTQRGHMTDAVAKWHAVSWNDADITAWNLYASTLGPMSGFNAFVREFIAGAIAAKTWTELYGVAISNVAADGFDVTVNVAADKTAKLYYGTSKTRMTNEVAGTYDSGAGTYTFSLTGLSSDTKYYFYIKNTDATDCGRVGIYTQKTS